MTASDLATIELQQRELASLSFDEIMAQLADTNSGIKVVSRDLIKDKGELIGVPNVITRIAFIPGDFPGTDYVALEATVASETVLKDEIQKGRLTIVNDVKNLSVEPDQTIVYLDGGTGIRRQVVAMLVRFGIVTVPEVGTFEHIVNGRPVENPLDLPFPMWTSCTQMSDGDDPRPVITHDHNGNQLALMSLRGLRMSEYDNDHAKGNITFYLS